LLPKKGDKPNTTGDCVALNLKAFLQYKVIDMEKLKILFTVTATILLLAGCTYDKKELLDIACTTPQTVSYKKDVDNILQANCSSCHNNSFNLGGVSLEGYNNAKAAAGSGKLFNVINHTPGFSKMPKGGNKLDKCSIELIKKWIDNGALNN
jgi:mono/diheme cytochrome c family protein